MSKSKIMLVVGSPKLKGSTSAVLGEYLLSKMKDAGFDTMKTTAVSLLKSDEKMEETVAATADADILVFAFPLYVDAVPYPLVKLMENIAERRKEHPNRKRIRLLAIVNCGFPEALHNKTALEICRLFSEENGFEWAGGLALGGGGVIDGQSLDKRRGLIKGIRRSLDLAADALINDSPIPAEAMQLMSRPLVPRWFYICAGESGGKRRARKNGVLKHLDARPYETGSH